MHECPVQTFLMSTLLFRWLWILLIMTHQDGGHTRSTRRSTQTDTPGPAAATPTSTWKTRHHPAPHFQNSAQSIKGYEYLYKIALGSS